MATAFHEAGHAVMALVVGRPVQRVSIEPNAVRLGRCELQRGRFRPTQDELEAEALFLLAGVAAQARHSGEYDWAGAADDLREVRELAASRAADERKAERLVRRLLDKTEHLLNRPAVWLAVEQIANELLRATTISGRAARHLFEQAAARAERG